jgi:protein-S-isoprenylcysteine O-methyltransferase Ste14
LVGHIAAIVVFLGGFGLFAWCISLFARVGQGTLAPWDPTSRLVAVGPYRYVRNPMISGVVTMLIGEALLHGSRVIAIWAATFIVINQVYFVLLEEPGLERRFGAAYLEYKSAVPRWIPRATPWKNA